MKKIQFWTLQILLVLLIIFVGTKISFVFHPIAVFVSTLFFPILISGFLFFMLNPIVQLLVKNKIPKTLAIVFIYLITVAVLVILGATVGPSISQQIASLVNDVPEMMNNLRDMVTESSSFQWILQQDLITLADIEAQVVSYSETFSKGIFSGLSGIFSFVANLTLIILTVPFMLFYMLKDGERLPDQIVRFIPTKYRDEGRKILKETNETLADYIQGQLIVCMFIAVATTVGYFIIGLKFALVLGLLIGVLNIVPYAGPWLGAAPAVIIAYLDSPMKALLVVIVIVVVQQIDGNFVSPLVIGNKLAVHPLTIVVLLLVAANLAGLLGMILAVPTYAVGRLLIKNFYRIWKLRSIA